ncbi:hypothetical protein M8818_001808 [Zalaria obscura]|uniref:Uncharacterized protein n=1 Tax=Zalaria obscura TaxID=2024903 RepID=A0ACC3SNZ3_9PEZI
MGCCGTICPVSISYSRTTSNCKPGILAAQIENRSSNHDPRLGEFSAQSRWCCLRECNPGCCEPRPFLGAPIPHPSSKECTYNSSLNVKPRGTTAVPGA